MDRPYQINNLYMRVSINYGVIYSKLPEHC